MKILRITQSNDRSTRALSMFFFFKKKGEPTQNNPSLLAIKSSTFSLDSYNAIVQSKIIFVAGCTKEFKKL